MFCSDRGFFRFMTQSYSAFLCGDGDLYDELETVIIARCTNRCLLSLTHTLCVYNVYESMFYLILYFYFIYLLIRKFYYHYVLMNLTVGIVYMDLCMFTSPTTVQKQSSEINKQVQRLLVSNQGLLNFAPSANHGEIDLHKKFPEKSRASGL